MKCRVGGQGSTDKSSVLQYSSVFSRFSVLFRKRVSDTIQKYHLIEKNDTPLSMLQEAKTASLYGTVLNRLGYRVRHDRTYW